jgi:hypothetical protein
VVDPGVDKTLVEDGPDGQTVIMPIGDWYDSLGYTAYAIQDLLMWEGEMNQPELDPMPPRKTRRTVTGKVTRKGRSGPNVRDQT